MFFGRLGYNPERCFARYNVTLRALAASHPRFVSSDFVQNSITDRGFRKTDCVMICIPDGCHDFVNPHSHWRVNKPCSFPGPGGLRRKKKLRYQSTPSTGSFGSFYRMLPERTARSRKILRVELFSGCAVRIAQFLVSCHNHTRLGRPHGIHQIGYKNDQAHLAILAIVFVISTDHEEPERRGFIRKLYVGSCPC